MTPCSGCPSRSAAACGWSGPVDEDTKAWLLHHATALAYPSLDEGFGFPILEAQSVGVPVVATRAGSIPEVAGGGAELVPLGDVDALAGALARVVDDEDRRARAGRRRAGQPRPVLVVGHGGRPGPPVPASARKTR